ncbi:MAG: PQQ-binding-like beta-propeller repeat protein [Steroidobacteraceae bacterium]
MRGQSCWVASAALILLGALASPAQAASRPQADQISPAPVPFTAAQARRGALVYGGSCAKCHGGQLEGASGPALRGTDFAQQWGRGHTLAQLESALEAMPVNSPGSLPSRDYLDLAAYLLSRNGYAPGPHALTASVIASLGAPGENAAGGSADDEDAAGPRHPDLSLPALPVSVAQPTTSAPSQDELLHPRPQDWLLYNGDYRSQRYSALDQIDAQNAPSLTPVCVLQIGAPGSFESGPIIYRGIAYVTTARTVQAFDAATCQRRWSYTYTPIDKQPLPTNRGVALYEGRLFRGTTDGHLLALDAATGKLLWDAHVADSSAGYFVSAAPIAIDGRVIVGLAGADWGANGRLYAFDPATGKRLWAFDFIPTGTQFGADSWKRGSAHGGGSSWTSVSVDPERQLVFAPVGNPGPDFDLTQRPGSNLFTDSVVALDLRTGKLAWYAQQIPGDSHDWDTTAAPVLYQQDGRRYLAVVNKGGWLYLYDRATHALLSKSEVSIHSNADVTVGITPVHTCPGLQGGVEWNGPAYDPSQQALYVGSVDWCGEFSRKPSGYVAGLFYFEGRFKSDPPASARGWVRAFDAATGQQRWAYHDPAPVDAGLTPTAGGVLFTGDQDGWFLVFDVRTGRVLYRFQTGGAIGGGVATYEVGGRQYVMVASGNDSRTMARASGSATVVVFALPAAPPRSR